VNPILREFAEPAGDDDRPDFMVTLGLAAPYTLEDVKQAYLEKAKQVHPDRGGSPEEFNALQGAFERAKAFVAFRADRRTWIAGQMDRYLALQRAVDRLRRLGAEVTTNAYDWMEHSFGDFAQLTETVVGVSAIDAPNGDEIIAAMCEEHDALRELREIELSGSTVSDDAVLSLRIFTMLRRLDLSRTQISNRALSIADVETLEDLNLDETPIGWWAKRRITACVRRRAE
jgi:hypothetical protein